MSQRGVSLRLHGWPLGPALSFINCLAPHTGIYPPRGHGEWLFMACWGGFPHPFCSFKLSVVITVCPRQDFPRRTVATKLVLSKLNTTSCKTLLDRGCSNGSTDSPRGSRLRRAGCPGSPVPIVAVGAVVSGARALGAWQNQALWDQPASTCLLACSSEEQGAWEGWAVTVSVPVYRLDGFRETLMG